MPFPATHPALATALAEKNYAEPTPVQSAVLEPGTEERDLLVSAQTGSGKTVAFGLAMASSLLAGEDGFGPAGDPLALIIAPTRELALQVHQELSWLYGKAGAQVISCVGGMDIRREARALSVGCHIVVGTPGRLRDHLERGRIETASLRVVVLDEADEMLNLGFREDLEFMLEAMPPERRTLLFSATIAKDIAALAKRYQRDALRINTIATATPHADIEYRAIRIAPNDLENAVVNLLRFYEAPNALVFCATREAVKHLLAALLERGFFAVSLSGEMSQNDRSHAMQALRDGRARVCVATDVAARGLDLPDLGLVIHADLPRERETLLHRSGRTGRAGRKGVSALLVPHPRRRRAEMLLSAAGVNATWAQAPSVEEIRARDQDRLMQDPIFSGEATEEDTALAAALLAVRSPDEIANALAKLYRSRLPAPEDLIDAGPDRGGGTRPDRPEGEPGPRFREQGPMVSFRVNIGRKNNADPRWLLPLICRLGHVTKKEVGAIRIFDNDTRFEIAEAFAAKFAAAARKTDDEDIRITPDTGAPDAEARAPRDRAKSGDKGKSWDKTKPWEKPKSGLRDRPGFKGKPGFRDRAEPRDRPEFRDVPPGGTGTGEDRRGPKKAKPYPSDKPFKSTKPGFKGEGKPDRIGLDRGGPDRGGPEGAPKPKKERYVSKAERGMASSSGKPAFSEKPKKPGRTDKPGKPGKRG
jgi:ATP-dependent RNA helicase DeaD